MFVKVFSFQIKYDQPSLYTLYLHLEYRIKVYVDLLI
jgi:hypothetical protein